MTVRQKRITISSAVLLASGAILSLGSIGVAHADTVMKGTGVSLPDPMAGCVVGPGSANGSADILDTMNPSVVRLQPRECARLWNATPSLSWALPSNLSSTTKTFTLFLYGPGNKTVLNLSGIVHPWINLTTQLLTANQVTNGKLAPGAYYWQIEYTASDGNHKFTRNRWFEVRQEALNVTFPNGAEVLRRVKLAGDQSKSGARRMLPPGATFQAIANAAKNGEYKAAYTGLMNAANKAIAINPSTGQVPPPPKPDYVPPSPSLMHVTQDERLLIEELSLAAFFNESQYVGKVNPYQTQAITHLLSLAQWNVNGVTSQANDDQSNREILLALAEGLDFFRDRLNTTQIASLVNPLHARICQIFDGNNCTTITGFDGWPNYSHMLTAIKYVTQALLHVGGMQYYGTSGPMLTSVWEYYLTALQGFTNDDGSFGNGVAYGWYNMEALAPSIAAARVIAGVDLGQQPAVINIGRYLMNMTPAYLNQMSPIGDETETNTQYANGTPQSFRLYSALTGVSQYEWYWRVRGPSLTNQISPGIWNYMSLGMNNGGPIALQPPGMLAGSSFLFQNTGVVAMHAPNTTGFMLGNAVSDSYRSSVYFHSSRYGSYNHSHAAQNSFELVTRGANVLISGGYYPRYGTPYHLNVTRATRYKNALTVDGGIGQAEVAPSATSAPTVPGAPVDTMETSGKLVNFYGGNGNWAVATGDASNAYRYLAPDGSWKPLLKKAIRTVAYNRNRRVLVVYDYAESDIPRTWELNFHSLGGFDSANVNMIRAIGANDASGKPVTACIDFQNMIGNFTVTNQFDPKYPINSSNPYPAQYHLRYASKYKSTKFETVTIIREDCTSISRPVVFDTSTGSSTRMKLTLGTDAPIYFDQALIQVPAN